ncbi:MAG: hypothetical protein GW886_07400 [Rhodobacterales bacterium]|nr:hypothetical protein [Rhodobacterales bacterium]NCT12394.1 hypothetical protein [Rhodobacterales bacterium]
MSGAQEASPACAAIPGSTESCVRVLACIGTAGLWFDAQAIGWDTGTVHGSTSDGSPCTGTWNADGPLGMGVAALRCDSGLTADVFYYNQDNATGTVIGAGQDNRGRGISVWTGTNVLEFLTPDGHLAARLPCGGGEIPIS